MLRDMRAALVDEDASNGVYLFCDVDIGCGDIDATYTFDHASNLLSMCWSRVGST